METSWKRFYVFGGLKGESRFLGLQFIQRNLNVIASFSTATMQWKKLGYLNEARNGHGVIFHRGEFIIVGGYDSDIRSLSTERCILNVFSVQCSTVDPKFEGFYLYPEMMSISENFCPK